jgi:hypothetical protein
LRYIVVSVSVMLLALSLGGNSWAGSPCANENKETAWDRQRAKAPTSPEALARSMEAFRAECGLPLGFWAGPKAEQSQKNDHPCGEWVQAFVKIMPSPSDPVIQSEEVFEFGSAGEVIQRWWVPVDSVIEGVAGDELLIPEELGKGGSTPVQLAISPRGTFRVIPFSANSPRASITCPASRDLPHSSYVECWRLSDKVSGTERRFAYEGPCS